MAGVVLRGAVEIEDPLGVALGFLEAYGPDDSTGTMAPNTFDELDLKRANRGGARISAAEQAAVLARRRRIEAALREIPVGASLAAPTVAWASLTRLFGGFGEIRGLGFAKLTKALHGKRPALIPILDSVVQAYLASDEPAPPEFGERATALVRSYKQDLDRNCPALRQVARGLAQRDYELTEVRILDVLIWSALS
ncbi:MAG TPA: DUF6308 family protein [Gaiellaceae bacterium]|nr:DUF6308 family protein [Gaiellaceae bacterium]